MEPTTELKAQVAGTSDEGLLKSFAALTHRLHAAARKTGTSDAQERVYTAKADRLRAQRDILEAEILRRMNNRLTCAEVENHLEQCTVFRHTD